MSPRVFDRYMVAHGAGHHLKFRTFTPAEKCAHFLGVLSIASQAPVRGSFCIGERAATAEDVAWEAGVPVSAAKKALAKLRELGVLRMDDELHREVVHDFDDLNPAPRSKPSDDPERTRQRKRAERERRAQDDVSRPLVTPGVTPAVTPVSRDVTPPEVEGEGETPQTPEGAGVENSDDGKVVSFDRRPVPKPRLALAERLLDDFNTAAGTRHNAYTGRGKPTESLKRIIGALTDHPNVSLDQWQAAIRWRVAHPFWDGKPDTGVVFGPGAVQGNLASAMQSRPADDPGYRSKLLGDPA